MKHKFAHIRFPAVIVENSEPVECALEVDRWCDDIACYISGTSEKSVLIDADGRMYAFLPRNSEGECFPGRFLGITDIKYIYKTAVTHLKKIKAEIDFNESSSIERIIVELHNKMGS